MSKPRRPLNLGKANSATTRTFFITTSTWERRSIFQSERLARLFLTVLLEYRAQERYLLHEYVLMPDHLHALISVPPGTTIEQALQLIKGGFSFRAKKEAGFQGEIWQRGFGDEFVADAEGFRARSLYIRQNPVRAGLVRAPEEYPYGSVGSEQAMDFMPLHLQGLKPREKFVGVSLRHD